MKMAKFPILIAINKNFNIKLTILKSTTAIIFSALFLFMVHGQLSYCQDSFSVIYLEELQDDYILNDDLYILHDSLNNLSISDVNSQAFRSSFRPYNNSKELKPLDTYWVHFQLQSSNDFRHYYKNWKLFIGEADYAEVYILDTINQVIQKKTTGNWYPLSLKEEVLEFKQQRVNLSFDPKDRLNFYIKYQRKDHHKHKIDIHLKKYDFYQSVPYLFDTWQNWLFLGFVLTMLLFNFIFYFGTRFIAFFYHGLFITGTVLLTLDFFGITGNLYFVKDHPYLVQLVTVLGTAIADITYFQFMRHYLSLKDILPKWDKVLFSQVIIKCIFWPSIMIYYYSSYNEPLTDKIIVAFLLVQYIIAWVFLIFLLKKKQKNSLWLFLGNGFLIFLIVINMISLLNSTGISSAYTQIGVVGEILCFSIGLAFRFKDLRAEEQEAKLLKVAEAKVRGLLRQQVSGAVAEALMTKTFLSADEQRFVSIMFLDIRDFTVFCEGKSPKEIIAYQNSVFGFIINIIEKHHGVVNQLMGDGFMATFGAPVSVGNDCKNAYKASFEIMKKLESKVTKKKIYPTKIGIGLHAGYVVTGNVGNEKRKQFSITGNTVILAARLEQLNKNLESTLVYSKDLYDKLPAKYKTEVTFQSVYVKGRSEPIEIVAVK